MLNFTEKNYNKKTEGKTLVLVADIGGTNTTFAVLQKQKDRLKLLFSLHFKSQEITDFAETVDEVLSCIKGKYEITVSSACFAGAGPVSEKNDFCKITHLPWDIDAGNVLKKTALKKVIIINDFEAVAYGIGALPPHSIMQVKKGKISKRNLPQAVLGAGTDLGKAILLWNAEKKRYIPIASEGGHANLAVVNSEELKLLEFIKTKQEADDVTWGDVLSGRGISSIYRFLDETRYYTLTEQAAEIKEANYNPALIAKHRNHDDRCKDTMAMFLCFYARCAKSLALDILAFGGVYLAGGIAAKNPAIFKQKIFQEEFVNNHKQRELLEQIPVFVVADYNVSLYGAAVVAETL